MLAPEMMDPIQTVKPKDSRTLMVEFTSKTGATHYIVRVQDSNGFLREDTVSSSPAEIQSLTPYSEYTLSIMAVSGGGRSQPSPSETAKTGTVVVSPGAFCIFPSEMNSTVKNPPKNTRGLVYV